MTSLKYGPAWLFCPADRPERFAKAAKAADIVILDLEDGVAPADKPAAREALIDTQLDPERTVVRINPHDTEDHALDCETLAKTGYHAIMLAKCEAPAQLRDLFDYEVFGLIETPLGAVRVADIAQTPNLRGLMWGAEDLIAGMGGQSSRRRDGTYRDVARHVRSSVLLAATAFDRLALDAVYIDIRDIDGLRDEAIDAAATGFDAKVAIHPSQVAVVREAFAPAPEEVGWARRVLTQADGERGVFAFEGRMVDAPVLRHAEAVVARAEAARQEGPK
ncbi:HpcH/HpaI aldolase/citrate lyase family protein [Hoyosella altamirensis]|uniref:Citrate lyase subunit beta/citryl-CoA lyase n=1 Tax=Hoyosella altamirensis TaxID=616997 RepID=A0A839RQ62_9ACTN|nr:CoA ester lyase [Hoyosella altamirensis]MBB3038358.1 citrate lyase subunit beta/citryl-CoA lyase [Hoyosella altamirensis]